MIARDTRIALTAGMLAGLTLVGLRWAARRMTAGLVEAADRAEEGSIDGS